MSNSATQGTVACQAPLSMEFSRQEYCSGLPFPSPGDLANPGIEPRSPTLQADSLPAVPQGKPQKTLVVSLPLLQWIFQESTWGLLHYRQILYQLCLSGKPSQGDEPDSEFGLSTVYHGQQVCHLKVFVEIVQIITEG